MADKRTITLTGRPPVVITVENWPLIASASDKEFDNQHEFQANRISKWFIGVRQHQDGDSAHADGRYIVYATYSYESDLRGERCYSAKNGLILDNASDEDICNAIQQVALAMACEECNSEDGERWKTLASGCIADMPAQELS